MISTVFCVNVVFDDSSNPIELVARVGSEVLHVEQQDAASMSERLTEFYIRAHSKISNIAVVVARDDAFDYVRRRLPGRPRVHSLETALVVLGKNPAAEYERHVHELPKGDPVADTHHYARLWSLVLSRTLGWTTPVSYSVTFSHDGTPQSSTGPTVMPDPFKLQ
jgi:hypothetical protein